MRRWQRWQWWWQWRPVTCRSCSTVWRMPRLRAARLYPHISKTQPKTVFAALSCFISNDNFHHGSATFSSIGLWMMSGEGPTASTVCTSISGLRNFLTTGSSFGSVEIM